MPMGELSSMVSNLEDKLKTLNIMMNGDPIKRRLDMGQPPSPFNRIGSINYEQKYSTAAPTKTHLESFEIAKNEFEPIKKMVTKLYTVDLIELENKLKMSGAPYTPGRVLENGQ
jgi:hypothetical protein